LEAELSRVRAELGDKEKMLESRHNEMKNVEVHYMQMKQTVEQSQHQLEIKHKEN